MSVAGSEPMQAAVRELLRSLGYGQQETAEDQHFERTPERVTESLLRFARRETYEVDVAQLLEITFEDAYSSLVMVGPSRYESMCAHHLLPVVGEAYVGYLADKRICGLSKLAKLVDLYARQLTVQERVTDQIADALMRHLEPLGCMVVIRAQHGCMTIRGVSDPGTFTTTSAVRGVHKDSANARSEFLSLVALRSKGEL
jgi:GTP cyclohydrolase I